MKMLSLAAMTALSLASVAASGCKTSKDANAADTSASSTEAVALPPSPIRIYNGPGLAALPQAQIYRTSIDVDALVPITVNPVDGSLISYPAPTDITGASMPVVLHDGWLLDRRGISPDTRFISYPYSRYHDLTAAPTPEELTAAIVPDARVTEIVSLPYKVGEVTPAMADSLISAGLPGCSVTYKLK